MGNASCPLFFLNYISLPVLQIVLLLSLLDGFRNTFAHEVTTTLEGRLHYPIRQHGTDTFLPYNITTKITLNHGDNFLTYSRSDGSFTVRNIPPGVHVIDIHSVTHHFPQIKCQFKPTIEESSLSCIEYAYSGAAKRPVELPLNIFATATYEYFEVRKGFSVFGILRNPMFLMMAFSAGMMLLMPKLMEGMDDEEKARMKQQMEMQKDPTKMLGQLWGDITGANAEEPRTTVVTKNRK